MFDIFQNYHGIFHYFLHLLVPAVFAYVFFRSEWKKAWIIMLGTMIVDVDHLLANPIFDPNRCSIGFHPLHSPVAIIVYALLLIAPNRYLKIVGLGLLLHMFADWVNCLMM